MWKGSNDKMKIRLKGVAKKLRDLLLEFRDPLCWELSHLDEIWEADAKSYRKTTNINAKNFTVYNACLPRCMKCRRGLGMRILSVCLAVCHTRDPWQNGRKIGPDFYTIRKNIQPSFLRRMVGGGGDPFYVKFWVNRPPLERNRRFSTNNRS